MTAIRTRRVRRVQMWHGGEYVMQRLIVMDLRGREVWIWDALFIGVRGQRS